VDVKRGEEVKMGGKPIVGLTNYLNSPLFLILYPIWEDKNVGSGRKS
jgi:hypothetical protein